MLVTFGLNGMLISSFKTQIIGSSSLTKLGICSINPSLFSMVNDLIPKPLPMLSKLNNKPNSLHPIVLFGKIILCLPY